MDHELICVESDNGKGFASRSNGNVIVPLQFSPLYQYYFKNDYCILYDEDLEEWHLFDRYGANITLPQGYAYVEESFVNNGLIPVKSAQSDLYGFADMDGNIRIDAQCLYAYPFNEGLACVQLSNEQWAMINTNDEITIYRPDIPYSGLSSPFCNHGLVRIGDVQEGCIHFLYKNGTDAFDIQHQGLCGVSDFFETGLAFYYVDEGERAGLFTDTGEVLINAEFYSPEEEYDEVHTASRLLPLRSVRTKKYGYVNSLGVWAIAPIYEKADLFYDCYAKVRDNYETHIIDESGIKILSFN